MEATKEKKHMLKMNVRRQLELSGVLAVERFDRERFEVETDCGQLLIAGANLHIRTLNLEQGILIIEGHVNSVQYADVRPGKRGKSLFGNMFK